MKKLLITAALLATGFTTQAVAKSEPQRPGFGPRNLICIEYPDGRIWCSRAV